MTASGSQTTTPGATIEGGLDERAAIRRALEDYFRGWFEADVAAMRRALHPRLAKLAVGVSGEDANGDQLDVTGFEAMIEATGQGRGVSRAGSGRIDVSILQVSGSMAAAEVHSDAYVELALLLRMAMGWRIVATTWRWADGAGPVAPG